MDRSLLFLTLAVFFGTGILFRAVQSLTENQSVAVTLLAQLAVGAVVVGAIVLIVRRRRRGGGGGGGS